MGPMTPTSPVTTTIFLAFPLKSPNTTAHPKQQMERQAPPAWPQLPQGAATPQAFPPPLFWLQSNFPLGGCVKHLRAVMVSYHCRSWEQWRLILLLLQARSPNTGACKPMSSLWLQKTALNPCVCSMLSSSSHGLTQSFHS